MRKFFFMVMFFSGMFLIVKGFGPPPPPPKPKKPVPLSPVIPFLIVGGAYLIYRITQKGKNNKEKK